MRALQNGYRSLMEKLLKKKAMVMGTAVVLVIFSLFLATKLKTELMPADDQGTIAVTIETQPGLKIEEVDKILQRAEDYVTQDPDLDSYMLSYGSSGLSMKMVGLFGQSGKPELSGQWDVHGKCGGSRIYSCQHTVR